MYISIHKLKPKLFRATFFLDRTSNEKIPKTFFSYIYYSKNIFFARLAEEGMFVGLRNNLYLCSRKIIREIWGKRF